MSELPIKLKYEKATKRQFTKGILAYYRITRPKPVGIPARARAIFLGIVKKGK